MTKKRAIKRAVEAADEELEEYGLEEWPSYYDACWECGGKGCYYCGFTCEGDEHDWSLYGTSCTRCLIPYEKVPTDLERLAAEGEPAFGERWAAIWPKKK